MVLVSIYALKDPRNEAIRYVGKTKLPLWKRLNGHQGDKSATRKARWLRQLARLGLAPDAVVLAKVSEEVWEKAERYWIKKCRASGCDLTNHTDGGDGIHNLDEEARVRYSQAARARFRKHGSKEYYKDPTRGAKISAALKGKHKSTEHVAKLPQNKPGWHHTEEAKTKIRKNARGHRWTKEEASELKLKNKGNRYGIGNRSRTGQVQSAKERAKKSTALRGRPKSEATKEKMRQSALKYWSNPKNKEKRNVQLSAFAHHISKRSKTKDKAN